MFFQPRFSSSILLDLFPLRDAKQQNGSALCPPADDEKRGIKNRPALDGDFAAAGEVVGDTMTTWCPACSASYLCLHMRSFCVRSAALLLFCSVSCSSNNFIIESSINNCAASSVSMAITEPRRIRMRRGICSCCLSGRVSACCCCCFCLRFISRTRDGKEGGVLTSAFSESRERGVRPRETSLAFANSMLEVERTLTFVFFTETVAGFVNDEEDGLIESTSDGGMGMLRRGTGGGL